MLNTISRRSRVGYPVRDLFNAVFTDSAGCCSNASGRIPLDILQHEDEYELRASLPGYSRDEVQLEVEKGVLTITAGASAPESSDEDEACGNGKSSCCGGEMLRQERYQGQLRRSVRLPENLEPSGVRAELKDGVLKITVSKPSLPEAQRIEIA